MRRGRRACAAVKPPCSALQLGHVAVVGLLIQLLDPVIAEGAERFDHSVAYYAVSRNVTNYGVFGTVVKCRKKLNWFEKRPLRGKRIVVTRTRKQASSAGCWVGVR